MSRSFGPVVILDSKTHQLIRVHCNWCVFRTWRDDGHACKFDHRNVQPIPDIDHTPQFCEMREEAVKDALEMAGDP